MLPTEELKTSVDLAVSDVGRLVRVGRTEDALLYSEALTDMVRELHSRATKLV